MNRRLIVNADDFGLSRGVNAGIIEAHERGIVTSAGLMVRWDAAVEAAEYARRASTLGLGLHLDLGEWRCEAGEWRPLYEVVAADAPSGDVEREMRRQLESFRHLVGRNPTHIDAHQHVHRREPARSAAVKLAKEIGVPLRHLASDAQYCGSFYGQTADGVSLPNALTVDALISILKSLPPGLNELCCHPAADVHDLPTATVYRGERLRELHALCDPSVRQAVADMNIHLCTFASRAEAL